MTDFGISPSIRPSTSPASAGTTNPCAECGRILLHGNDVWLQNRTTTKPLFVFLKTIFEVTHDRVHLNSFGNNRFKIPGDEPCRGRRTRTRIGWRIVFWQRWERSA